MAQSHRTVSGQFFPTMEYYLLLLLPAVAISEQNKYLGCYQELTETYYPRLFNDGYMTLHDKNNIIPQDCFKFCLAYGAQYAGIEEANGCYCSKIRPSYIYAAEESDCKYKCYGDKSKTCGGYNRLSVYQLNFLGGDEVSPMRIGCYADVAGDNILQKMVKSYSGLLTPERCMGHCWRRGYLLAGINGDECRCGDQLKEERKMSEGDCSTSCGGDSSIKCGGPGKLSIYTTGIKDDWGDNRKVGCFKNDEYLLMPTPVLRLHNTNSPRRCANICKFLGFKFSGVENKEECFCSDSEPESPHKVEVSDCQMPCPSDSTELCGGSWRISVSRTS